MLQTLELFVSFLSHFVSLAEASWSILKHLEVLTQVWLALHGVTGATTLTPLFVHPMVDFEQLRQCSTCRHFSAWHCTEHEIARSFSLRPVRAWEPSLQLPLLRISCPIADLKLKQWKDCITWFATVYLLAYSFFWVGSTKTSCRNLKKVKRALGPVGFWHCAVLQEYSRWQDGTHRWNSNTYQVCWKVGADLSCLLVQAFQISADLIVIICMQHTHTVS